MPVLPAVPSTIVPPGRRRPLASASSTMPLAARSLTEPPGFKNSAFPTIVRPSAAESFGRTICGVLPIVPAKPALSCETVMSGPNLPPQPESLLLLVAGSASFQITGKRRERSRPRIGSGACNVRGARVVKERVTGIAVNFDVVRFAELRQTCVERGDTGSRDARIACSPAPGERHADRVRVGDSEFS